MGIKVQTEDSLTNYDEVNSSTDGKKLKTRKMRPNENESSQCSAGNNEIVLEAIDADEISSSDDDVESLNLALEASDVSSDERAGQQHERGVAAAEEPVAQVSDISSDDLDNFEQQVVQSLPVGSPIISSDDDNLPLPSHKKKRKRRRKRRRRRV